MSGWIWIVAALVVGGYCGGLALWIALDRRWERWLS